MDPLTILLGLANFAPTLMKWVNAGDKAENVANKVADMAKAITGTSSTPEAIEMMQKNAEMAQQFNLAVMANSTELDRMYLADTADARKRSVALAQAGIANTRAQLLASFSAGLIVICLTVVVWMTTMDDFAKGIITLILGRALGWLEQIFSFEFGTTRINRTKDATINNLSQSKEQ